MYRKTFTARFGNFLWARRLNYLSFWSANRNKKFVFGVLSIFFIVAAYPAIFYLYMSYLPNKDSTVNYLTEVHRLRSAMKVRDATGAAVGSLKYNFLEKKGINDNLADRATSVFVTHVPVDFWEMLKFNEDRHLKLGKASLSGLYLSPKENRSVRGIDVFSQALRPLKSLPNVILYGGSEAKGGSGLFNMLIKNLFGEDHWKEVCGSGILGQICRKWDEIKYTGYLYDYLTEHDGDRFKRWVAMHAPLSISAGSIYGLESAANIIFSKRAADLSVAQQAYLAASYKKATRFSQKENGDDFVGNINFLKKRAKASVDALYSEERARIIKGEIDSISLKLPIIASSLQSLANNSGRTRVFGNPELRVGLFAGYKQYLSSELEGFPTFFSQKSLYPNEIKIALPIKRNKLFKQKLDGKLDDLLSSIPKSERDIRVTLANSEGRVIRMYRYGDYLEEKLDSDNIKRQVGSLSKVVALILVLREGAQLDTVVCKKRFHGLRDAGGYAGGPCNEEKNKINLRRTISSSSNLATMNALQKFSPSKKDVIDAINAFGVSFTEDPEEMTLTEMYRDLSWGLVAATPAQVHRIFNGLGVAFEGWSGNVGVYPFESISYFDEEKNILGNISVTELVSNYKAVHANADLTLIEFLEQNKPYLSGFKSALRSVARNGGTASFLNTLGMEPLFFKTGTTQTTDKNNKDKWLAGAFQYKGNQYSVSILMGTKKFTGSGLRNLTHKDVHGLVMREVLASIL